MRIEQLRIDVFPMQTLEGSDVVAGLRTLETPLEEIIPRIFVFPKRLMNFLDDGFLVVHTYLFLTQ